jgi:hypothetical protein
MPRGQYDRSGNADRSRIEAAVERGRAIQEQGTPHASPAADAARAKGTARTGEDNRDRQQSRGMTGNRGWDRLLNNLLNEREVENVRLEDGGNTIRISLFDDET